MENIDGKDRTRSKAQHGENEECCRILIHKETDHLDQQNQETKLEKKEWHFYPQEQSFMNITDT